MGLLNRINKNEIDNWNIRIEDWKIIKTTWWININWILRIRIRFDKIIILNFGFEKSYKRRKLHFQSPVESHPNETYSLGTILS